MCPVSCRAFPLLWRLQFSYQTIDFSAARGTVVLQHTALACHDVRGRFVAIPIPLQHKSSGVAVASRTIVTATALVHLVLWPTRMEAMPRCRLRGCSPATAPRSLLFRRRNRKKAASVSRKISLLAAWRDCCDAASRRRLFHGVTLPHHAIHLDY